MPKEDIVASHYLETHRGSRWQHKYLQSHRIENSPSPTIPSVCALLENWTGIMDEMISRKGSVVAIHAPTDLLS